MEHSQELFRLLKAAGLSIPQNCRKITIEAECQKPLLVRFECFSEAATSRVFAEAVKGASDDGTLKVDVANFESR